MNCIKCGRVIPEGELFCVECSLTPSAAAQPRRAAHPEARQPQPAKKAAPKAAPRAAQPPATQSARKEPARAASKAPPAPRRPVGLIVTLVVVCLLLTGAVAYIVWSYNSLSVERTRLRAKEADLVLRENELAELQQERDSLESQLQLAQDAVKALETEIEGLESQLSASESTMSQAQYDVTYQQQEMEKIVEENNELLTLVETLEGRIEGLDEEIERLSDSNAVYGEKANFMDSYVVFVNNDGSDEYHKYSCGQFKKQSFWAYSRRLAESNGYEPCQQCH